MSRTVTGAVDTELQQSRIRPRTLVHFDLAGGAVRLCDDIRDIVFSGDTYLGVGHLGKVSPIKETAGLRANGVQFSLSGIPSSLIDEATLQHLQGRTVEVWKAFLDSNDDLIADPVKVFAGRVDQMVIADSGDTAVITLTAENRLVDLEQPLETRFYTDQDQQTEFSGDLGMEFVTKMQRAVIIWGRVKLATGLGTTSDANPSSDLSVSTPPAQSVPDIPDAGDGVPDAGAGGDLGFGEDDAGNSFATTPDTP